MLTVTFALEFRPSAAVACFIDWLIVPRTSNTIKSYVDYARMLDRRRSSARKNEP